MRFVVDECTGPSVADWLRTRGYDVFSVYDEAPGIDDDAVLHIAVSQERVLITNDKDFGEMIFRDGKRHHGVVLLRVKDNRLASRLVVLQHLLDTCANQMAGNFVVATPNGVRILHLND